MCRFFRMVLCSTLLSFATGVWALEHPVGSPQIKNGMEIAAVYLQPIKMEPAGMMRDAKDSDIHLEADIHAVQKNPNGFAEGDWIPYLTVHYSLAQIIGKNKDGSMRLGKQQAGKLMPMVANDGPHYGDNIKLMGPGKYILTYTVSPPGKDSHFGRHIDKETGVQPWFKPFEVSYDFAYSGIGKKGAY